MVLVFVGGPRVGFSMTNVKLCIPLGIKYIDRPTPTTTIFVHFLQGGPTRFLSSLLEVSRPCECMASSMPISGSKHGNMMGRGAPGPQQAY